MTRTLLALAVATAALALAPAAHAVTYCVPTTGPTCTGTAQASFQAALDAAEAAGADTIEFTNSATYLGPFLYDPAQSLGGTLMIRGQPGAPPTLRSLVADTTTLNLETDDDDSLVTVRFMTIQAPTGGLGLQTLGNVEDSTITTAPAAQGSTGLYAVGSSLIDSVIISMTDNGSPEHRGMSTAKSNGIWAGATTIVDSTFTAYEAVNLNNEAVFHRNRLVSHGRGLLVMCAGGVDVDSVEMVVNGGGGIDARSSNQCGAGTPSIVDVRHLAMVGPGAGQPALSAEGGGGGDAQIDLKSSIVRGFDETIEREDNSSPGSTTAITVGFSNIDLTRVVTGSDGGATDLGGNVVNDPLFVAEAAGDLRVRWPSPAIDAGAFGGLLGGHSVGDRFQFPRVVDGDGDGAERRDMGAWEYRGPSTKVVQDRTTARVGEPVEFDAESTGTHPPDTPKTYQWTLDDGFTSTASGISHAFTTPGTHTGTVTVTDTVGREGTVSFSVVITAVPTPKPVPDPDPDPPAPPPATPTPPSVAAALPSAGAPPTAMADTTAPTLTAKVQRGRRTRRVRRPGRVLVVTLSERATVNAVLQRCRGGATCRRRSRVSSPTRSGGPGPVRIALSRTLAPGLYRVTITARDAAGNRSRPRTVLFTIPRAR